MSNSAGEEGLEVSAFSVPKMGKLRSFMVHVYLCFCILAFVVTATAKISSDFSLPLMNAVDPVFFFYKSEISFSDDFCCRIGGSLLSD